MTSGAWPARGGGPFWTRPSPTVTQAMNSFDPRFDPPVQRPDEQRLAPAPRPSGYRDGVRMRRSPGNGYGRSSGWAHSNSYAEASDEAYFRLG